MNLSHRAKGLAFAISGIVLLIPDALLLRLSGVDHWNSVFWRSLLGGVVVFAFVLWTRRQQPPLDAIKLSRPGWLLVGVLILANIGFVLSLYLTSVANAMIILALAPMFAALYDYLFSGKTLAKRTWLAIVCCLAGISMLVADGIGGGSHVGNLLALMTSVLLGLELSMMGSTEPRQVLPALGSSYLLSSVVAAFLAGSLSLAQANIAAMLLMGLLIVPVSFMLISQAPRYLPAPEVAMLLLLETVCSPLLVWWLLDETPGRYALFGGALVLLTLTWHSAMDLILERRNRLTRAPCSTSN